MQPRQENRPPRQENKWSRDQVIDRKEYKQDGDDHRDRAKKYGNWYLQEHKRAAVSNPTSTALGVNRLSPHTNKIGFAMSAGVAETAETLEAQKRAQFANNYPNAFPNPRKNKGHKAAIRFATQSAMEHKEQSNLHRNASQGNHVDYPEGHDPKDWKDDAGRRVKAKTEAKKSAQKLQAAGPVVDADGFKEVTSKKQGRGAKR